MLVRHFVQQFSRRTATYRDDSVGDDERSIRYDWPGNIRELQNVIERAVILSTGPGPASANDWTDLAATRAAERRPGTA